VGYFLVGVSQLIVAALLLWLGRPLPDGQSARFLERTKMHVPYILLFTAFFGFGLAFTISGLADLL